MQIKDCPHELISPDVWEVIRYSDLFEQGLPPVAGGALDQAYYFLEAAEFVKHEKDYWKNKLGMYE